MKYFDSRIFLSCILFTSSNLEAKTLDHLNFLCSDKIENVLQKWNVKPEFRSTLRTETVEVFESPTPELGTWVRIQKNNDSVDLEKLTDTHRLSFSFKEPKCRPDIEVITKKNFKNGLTDKDLRLEIDKTRSGIIYSWSPAMPLSILGVNEAQATAKMIKIKLIVVLDQNANETTAKQIVKKNRWPKEFLKKNSSFELSQRNLMNHFPSALFYKNGYIANEIFPGYKLSMSYKNEFELLK